MSTRYKVAELEGAELDTAVARTEGLTVEVLRRGPFCDFEGPCVRFDGRGPVVIGPLPAHAQDRIYNLQRYSPSTLWLWGGPIIERARVELIPYAIPRQGWYASVRDPNACAEGPTPLIAALRAYVLSKLGEEIELP